MASVFDPSRTDSAELGFGTTAFNGLTRAEAVRLLETAYASGVRHFDTARMYDHGRAEGTLGAMARSKRQSMVIVSKAGIAPPSLAGRALRRLAPRAAARLGEPRFGRFKRAQVEASLQASLRALGTDYLDVLLLHEIEPGQMSDDLATHLLRLKQSGAIRAAGLATSAVHTLALQKRYGDLFEVVQIPALSLIDVDVSQFSPARVILHSVLGRHLWTAFDQIDVAFAAKHGLTARPPNSEEVRKRLAELLLRTAITRNPGGVVLFASASAEHIRLNASLSGADPAVVREVEQLMRRAAG